MSWDLVSDEDRFANVDRLEAAASAVAVRTRWVVDGSDVELHVELACDRLVITPLGPDRCEVRILDKRVAELDDLLHALAGVDLSEEPVLAGAPSDQRRTRPRISDTPRRPRTCRRPRG